MSLAQRDLYQFFCAQLTENGKMLYFKKERENFELSFALKVEKRNMFPHIKIQVIALGSSKLCKKPEQQQSCDMHEQERKQTILSLPFLLIWSFQEMIKDYFNAIKNIAPGRCRDLKKKGETRKMACDQNIFQYILIP